MDPKADKALATEPRRLYSRHQVVADVAPCKPVRELRFRDEMNLPDLAMNAGQHMTCPFCRREFNAGQARAACKGCRSGGGCRNVKCPYCGYETPREPRWIGWLRRRFGK